MSSAENAIPLSPSAAIAFRRQSLENDEENATPRKMLPSPRREPLRVLRKNPNSKESLFDGSTGSGKVEASPRVSETATVANPKPPLVVKQRSNSESIADRNEKTPLKTPSSFVSSPLFWGRTPNAGKVLSPLPLQPRKLQNAKKEKVKIDTKEFLSKAPAVPTPNKGDLDEVFKSGFEDTSLGEDGLLDLRISKPFDEDESRDDADSLGWTYTLDDFQFVRKLGSGGSADVYEVLEKGSCGLYALKVQPANEDALCELDIQIPLKHKNVCQVLDYFYADERPFVDEDPPFEPSDREGEGQTRYLCTMLEACDHGDLHDLIDEHERVPENLAAKVILDSIRALQYLHSKDIIHCDIKPANWLVDGEDNEAIIKLADFGMAVTTDAKEIVGGTPVYMAPEHLMAWRELTDDFDHRTDIYSLGVILYELLLGYLPYEVLEADQSEGKLTAETEDPYECVAKEFLGLSVSDSEYTNNNQFEFDFPVLDLRKLNDKTSDEPFYIPPPIFVEDVSEEAQDLILRLMEPSVSKRITLEEALDHDWFRKVL